MQFNIIKHRTYIIYDNCSGKSVMKRLNGTRLNPLTPTIASVQQLLF